MLLIAMELTPARTMRPDFNILVGLVEFAVDHQRGRANGNVHEKRVVLVAGADRKLHRTAHRAVERQVVGIAVEHQCGPRADMPRCAVVDCQP